MDLPKETNLIRLEKIITYRSLGRHGSEHNDIQHNGTQLDGLICDTQHNDNRYNDIQYNDTQSA